MLYFVQKQTKNFLLLFFLFSTILPTISCTTFTEPTKTKLFDASKHKDLNSESFKLLLNISLINSNIQQSKGIGKLNVKSEEVFSSRFAWIAKFPDKLRLEILSPAGTPVYTIATDGTFFYFKSYLDNKFYKQDIKKVSLKEFVGVPISIRNLLYFLLGRTPVYDHNNIIVDDKNDLLSLVDENEKIIEKIYFKEKIVTKIEFSCPKEKLLYKANFLSKLNSDDLIIPKKIVLSDSEKNRCEFKIDRFYFKNLKQNSSIFTLKKD